MKPLKARMIYGFEKSWEFVLFRPQRGAQRDDRRHTFTYLTQTRLLKYPDCTDILLIELPCFVFSFTFEFLKSCVVWLSVFPKTKQKKNKKHFFQSKKSSFLKMTTCEFPSANLTHHIPSVTGCFNCVWLLLAATVELRTCVRTGLLTLHHICGQIEAVWQTRPPRRTRAPWL